MRKKERLLRQATQEQSYNHLEALMDKKRRADAELDKKCARTNSQVSNQK